jgi:hypothetical protein
MQNKKKCEKGGKLEEVLTIKQRHLTTEYFMFTDDIYEEKAKEIEQETGKAYFTRLIDVHGSSNTDTYYRSL